MRRVIKAIADALLAIRDDWFALAMALLLVGVMVAYIIDVH